VSKGISNGPHEGVGGGRFLLFWFGRRGKRGKPGAEAFEAQKREGGGMTEKYAWGNKTPIAGRRKLTVHSEGAGC